MKSLNKKGFTLVEVLVTLLIVSLIFIYVLSNIGETLSLSNEKAYEITKQNVLESANTYILECNSKMIDCSNDLSWEKEENITKTSFFVEVLISHGYLETKENVLLSPIDNKNLNNCLQINVIKNNLTNMYEYEINDNLCKN